MYLDHFGLREAPFRITPHTEFFFAGARRGATLEALIYAITQDEGIVKVSGEVGSGKTMLCRMLLEKLPPSVETVYLANPSLSRHEILHAIAAELQAPLPEHQTQLLQKSLQDRLLGIHARGRLVVMLIDEAHAMPPETLEEIRLLSNLETNRHKLLHIVLFGQPELEQRLGETSMRQLKERITHNFELEPLRRDDIGTYLMFRMRAAGYRGPDLFTAGALQLISRASEGLTRRINILADKALLSAYAENTHQIDRPQIKAAIHDAQFKPMHERGGNSAGWLKGGAAIALLAAVMYLAGNWLPGNDSLVATAKKFLALAKQATGAAAPVPLATQGLSTPVTMPTPASPVVALAPTLPAADVEPIVPSARRAPMALVVREAPVAPVVPVPPAAAEVQVAQASTDIPLVYPSPDETPPPPALSPAAADPAPANTPAVATPADFGRPGSVPPASAQLASTPSSSSLPPVVAAAPPTFAERLATTAAWIAATPDSHYFIQLLSTAGSSESDVERFLENETLGLDPEQIRVYRSSLSGRDRLGVIYGDFSSPSAASAELARLASASNLNPARKPYIRPVNKLR